MINNGANRGAIGETTTAMAEAIANSPAKKFLIGIRQPHVKIIGMEDTSINEFMEQLIMELKEYLAN